jgi:hypothetical protein
MSRIKLLLDVVEDLTALTDSLRSLAQALATDEPDTESAPAMSPAPPPAPPQKAISLEEVRSVLGQKSRKGFTDEVRGLLQKYGADKLSDVDPKFYEAILNDAEVLGDAT